MPGPWKLITAWRLIEIHFVIRNKLIELTGRIMRRTQLATLVAGAMLAMNAQALDLMEALSAAQAYDSQFMSARAAREASAEKLPQGRSGLLPSAALSGSYSKIQGDGSFTIPTAFQKHLDYNSKGYQLQLKQPLFNMASFDSYEQSKLLTAIGDIQFEQAKMDLLLRVAQAYFDVLAAQDAISFIQAQKTAITEQLASAKRNFEVGTATITDTHEAQARYDLTLAQEIAALNDLEVKRNALAVVIGKVPNELNQLSAGIKLASPEPANIDKWVENAEVGNVGVVAQKLAVDIAKLEISRNRAGHFPTLDAIASRSRTQGFSSDPLAIVESTSVGVQLNIPLFSGFAVTSKVREAIALENQARADLDTNRRNATQAARTAYLGVQSGLSQVKALEAAEVSSNSALESNKLGYEVGVRINIDVLNAQQQLYSTRRDLAKARYDTLVNSLKLKAATGSLTESDMAQINSLLSK
jgi:outer membrane protein